MNYKLSRFVSRRNTSTKADLTPVMDTPVSYTSGLHLIEMPKDLAEPEFHRLREL